MEISRQEVRWVLRAQAGDREALDELLRLVQQSLYRYICSLVGTTSLAEDIRSHEAAKNQKQLVLPRGFVVGEVLLHSPFPICYCYLSFIILRQGGVKHVSLSSSVMSVARRGRVDSRS